MQKEQEGFCCSCSCTEQFFNAQKHCGTIYSYSKPCQSTYWTSKRSLTTSIRKHCERLSRHMISSNKTSRICM
uniref:Uncharacterized protein n=1 Tax=Octopus bimaculoides TaxID=37653 RepID=A0A0L8IF08_OCTBM